MRAPSSPRRWRRVTKIALFALVAIASVPFILVALFGNAGGRR